jgi:GTP cyclohydrolase II
MKTSTRGSAPSTAKEIPLSLIELKQIAQVKFPTRWTDFHLLAFEGTYTSPDNKENCVQTALALIAGNLYRDAPVVRIHSQCATGDVFHSLRCDCHDQLHLALRTIAELGTGILLYEHQEGRGIGLMEKLKAYELQDQGLDTIEANLRLGHAIDHRDYQLPVDILCSLNIRRVRLMTNNPEKIRAVTLSGIQIVERLNAEVPIDPHCADYVATKREKLGHLSTHPVASLIS